MRRHARAVLCATVVAFSVVPSLAHAQSSVLATQFRSLLVARYAAIVRGDSAALSPHFADDLSWVVLANAGADLTKPQLLALIAQPQVPPPRFDVDSVHAQRFGDVAIVEYQRSDHRQVGSRKQTTSVRSQEVFVMRHGRWLLERHTQAWVVMPVTPVVLDPTTLHAFIGRYQIASGYVDNVHWENNELVATASGQTVGARLVPVSSTAFSPDGVGAVIVFERDSTGRVLGYVQAYPNGEVVRAVRLP